MRSIVLPLKKRISGSLVIAGLFLLHPSSVYAASQASTLSNVLTLQAAIEYAHTFDDWLVKSQLLESRLQQLSAGAQTLPDPTINIGVLNLPTDGFALNQEPMTQMKIGASQMFPRGDTLALQQERYQLSAHEQPLLRDHRRDQITLQATQLWLSAYKASASYQLVEEARPLFDKLGDIVSASYASSSGMANQQDIIRAELELVRLNDRLITLASAQDVALSRLSQFLSTANTVSSHANLHAVNLPQSLPKITRVHQQQILAIKQTPAERLHELIAGHALVAANEQRVKASLVDIEIAKQAYKPQYGLNASYGIRADSPSALGGDSRANFFSIGLSISVPLFSNARQDAKVSGATYMTEAMRTEKRLVMQELMAGLNSAFASYQGASQRLTLYEQQILPQMTQQTQAALNAYTNDSGDFAEVVRAKIDELDTQLTTLNIRIEQRMALATMAYFYAPNPTISASLTGDALHE